MSQQPMKLTDERLAQIRHVLGSCSLEANSKPTLYDELDGHIRALTDALAAKEAFKEEVEVVAQVNGWPGYSQGGHPAKYLNDTIAELQEKVAIQPSRGEQG